MHLWHIFNRPMPTLHHQKHRHPTETPYFPKTNKSSFVYSICISAEFSNHRRAGNCFIRLRFDSTLGIWV